MISIVSPWLIQIYQTSALHEKRSKKFISSSLPLHLNWKLLLLFHLPGGIWLADIVYYLLLPTTQVELLNTAKTSFIIKNKITSSTLKVKYSPAEESRHHNSGFFTFWRGSGCLPGSTYKYVQAAETYFCEFRKNGIVFCNCRQPHIKWQFLPIPSERVVLHAKASYKEKLIWVRALQLSKSTSLQCLTHH